MRQGDAGDVENRSASRKPASSVARASISLAAGAHCVFCHGRLGLFVVWPLSLALTAAAQARSRAAPRDGIPRARARSALPLPDDGPRSLTADTSPSSRIPPPR